MLILTLILYISGIVTSITRYTLVLILSTEYGIHCSELVRGYGRRSTAYFSSFIGVPVLMLAIWNSD